MLTHVKSHDGATGRHPMTRVTRSLFDGDVALHLFGHFILYSYTGDVYVHMNCIIFGVSRSGGVQ